MIHCNRIEAPSTARPETNAANTIEAVEEICCRRGGSALDFIAWNSPLPPAKILVARVARKSGRSHPVEGSRQLFVGRRPGPRFSPNLFIAETLRPALELR